MPDERSITEVVAELRNVAAVPELTSRPLPWGWHRSDRTETVYVEDPDGNDVAAIEWVPEPWKEDIAAFIVAACNNALRLCDEIERLTRMLEVLPGLIEEMQTYAGDDEVIVLTQSSYNQLREDAGWPVVWSDKKPQDVQAWREFMKGGE